MGKGFFPFRRMHRDAFCSAAQFEEHLTLCICFMNKNPVDSSAHILHNLLVNKSHRGPSVF